MSKRPGVSTIVIFFDIEDPSYLRSMLIGVTLRVSLLENGLTFTFSKSLFKGFLKSIY
jgi:hypothetical protein